MRIKVGDLVYRKVNEYINSRHNNEIWLVLGKGSYAHENRNGHFLTETDPQELDII